MAVRIQLRRDTAAQWALINPILAEGEIGLELDTDQFKIGDGLTAWADLPYGGIQGPPGKVIVEFNMTCDTSVAAGDWVYVDNGVVYRASASNANTSNVLGMVQYKIGGTIANILLQGLSMPVFQNLDVSKEYFLSENPGKMTTLPPTSSGSVLVKLGQPISTSEFLIHKGYRIVRA